MDGILSEEEEKLNTKCFGEELLGIIKGVAN